MQTLRPPAKAGIVFLGLVVALAIAWVAVDIRQRATQGPEAQASAGMYAFGDLVLGVGVFGVLGFAPLALGLYWLRPVARFWSALTWVAMLFASTGLLALAASAWAKNSTSGWIFLSHARIGLMPLTALAFLIGAIFAPQKRQRWLFFAAAIADGTIFAGVLLVKFILHS